MKYLLGLTVFFSICLPRSNTKKDFKSLDAR